MLKRIPELIATIARRYQRAFVAGVITVTVLAWTAVGASAWFLRDVVTGLPSEAALHSVSAMKQATTLFDVEGRPAFTIFKEQRIEVPLASMSPHLRRAIVSIEDQRFFEHGGVDIVRVAGAAVSNVREGRRAQGGSTLTQQLARHAFLTPDKTIRRKLKEVVVAARLERQFSKDQILELYLNRVYFGNGLHGAEAASLGYFGKHAAELDVAEAALLAGLVKSPSTYAPTVNLDRAVARRKVVLDAMLGTRAIDRVTYGDAVDAPVRLVDGLNGEETFGQYFKEEVRRELVQRFGWDRVYQGGLKVYTTLDLDLQTAAEAEVTRGLAAIEARQSRRRTPAGTAAVTPAEPLQAAIVALDPATGEVRAMVGGRDFAQSHFNRATQARRQPGSAFKPFIYAAAVERGYSPATLITNLNEPTMTVEGAWVPEDEHSAGDTMTMRAALRTSSNRAAVRMLQEVGIPTTVSYAQRLGVGSVPSVPSLALGSGEVTLVSMTAAFAAFANKGMVPTPTLIRRVETADGTVLLEGGAAPRRAVSESTAFLMTTMLADVIDAGTAASARSLGFTLPAAGKTGTTNDYHDAWFVGYTPKLVAGVWVGYDQPKTIIGNGYASELAVPIWARFMAKATAGHARERFRAPVSVTSGSICRLSGRLATESCRGADVVDDEGVVTRQSMVYTEYFLRGTEPTDYCPIHGAFHGSFGMLATTGSGVGGVVGNAVGSAVGGADRGDSSSPPSPVAASQKPEPPAAEANQPQESKKRGFWSRIFGRGDDKDKSQDKK
jgi:1A family penicillin-binding protein